MGRDIFHQTKVLQAPSNPALDTAREGAATASLGNLGQGLTTLMGKNFFLISTLNLPSFSLKLLPLVLSVPQLRGSPAASACLHPTPLKMPMGRNPQEPTLSLCMDQRVPEGAGGMQKSSTRRIPGQGGGKKNEAKPSCFEHGSDTA